MDWSFVLSWTINGIILLNILLAIVVIFIERRDAGATWAWLLILFFLPILGFIIYLFLGRQLKSDNFYNLSIDEQFYQSKQVQEQLTRVNETGSRMEEIIAPKYDQLMEMNLRSSKSLLSINNKSLVLHDGEEKFRMLLEDIYKAKEEVNIQYYIIQKDALGKRLLDALINRAKAGVKVRILYDAVGSKSLKLRDFKELEAHKGEVSVFFPSLLGVINFRLNNRNHRKVGIIDGKIAYVGGFNVGNEYLGLDKKFGYWRDTHLRLEGDVVHHLQDRFILDWSYARGDEKNLDEAFCFARHKVTEEAPMQIVTSGPNSNTEHLKNMLMKMIMSAERDVYIQTPYFIPDKSFMDACRMALLSGVNLHIMIPGKPDHPFVMWASWSFLGQLLRYGADVYLYDGGFLHAKTLMVDHEIATIGTTNLDARSFRLNFEINALAYDKKIAAELGRLFEQDAACCRRLTKEEYEKRGWTVKVREGVSSLLSPIL
ncbi:cardiolipin synthase [Alkalicoccus daliensis]|uniref:Cardiolipin synthase n=1 Tax=Alkalicoccus daliensis TaxID=745820 RepID=A0A1H0GXU2_9BACI|nr:cardiolipin synthase [Alkalicoccus daliensis]SDO11693.1 cardiolipin synthase [Alkalicoccus daliensis]